MEYIGMLLMGGIVGFVAAEAFGFLTSKYWLAVVFWLASFIIYDFNS